MTDIKRHLPEIFKLVKKSLTIPAHEEGGLTALYEQVRELLPKSYGLAVNAQVVNQAGETSQPVDLLVYDLTVQPAELIKHENAIALSQTLAAIQVAPAYDQAGLRQSFEIIKSVKGLRSASPPAVESQSSGRHIPKSLFPLGVILTSQLQISGENTPTAQKSGEFIYETMQDFRGEERPDYCEMFGVGLSYRNPVLLEEYCQPLTGEERGLSRLPKLAKPRPCYICKQFYQRRHFFYDYLCLSCGDFNYDRREARTDLSGRIALVTGVRIKLGYAVALRLLRAGAQVIGTTRFPHDAARRFAAEPDFEQWRDRLELYGLDFRYLAGVEHFVQYFNETYPRLDILINNAAQTVRRPPAFYVHLLPFEELSLSELPPALQPLVQRNALTSLPARLPPAHSDLTIALSLPNGQIGTPRSAAHLSQLPLLAEDLETEPDLFPVGQYDQDGQQLDRRLHNSWTLRLQDLSLPEMVEVQLVNAVVPGLLVGRLKERLAEGAAHHNGSYIINVAAAEGQFVENKRNLHPHTNMAKAAINMLTLSVASDYAESKIWVYSVDPGWVSDQLPLPTIENRPAKPAYYTQLPLDLTDGAARICDPIFLGVAGQPPESGRLLKDYKVAPW